ncbi:hypothetical protein B0H63DRAFT_455092 [Podospora didyma]|uniref:Fungal N-terminal domain-containing protein n=1 Tax=Podospora didyma TaxID=330526 RepID=A0AAE0N2H6_9PEZI|nr:hypothetical protein B0H63DRAFT_455092 [Podospora didyma]
MAEPLSLAASVAGVASVGYSIAKGLYQIADDMSVAGLEVRVYASEIDSFAKLLLHVQRTIDSLTCSAKEIAEIKTQIRDILDNCDRILKPLHDVQQALVPLLERFHDSPSKLLQVALRVRWAFVAKGKILFYRELLQRQHQMLDTHLARATLVSIQDKKDQPLVQMLHTSLENSVSALNHTIASPEFAQAQSQARLRLGFRGDVSFPSRAEEARGSFCPPSIRSGPPSRPSSTGGFARGVSESSMALVLRPPKSGPTDEPMLVGMTEQEVQSVLAATSLDIDVQTMDGMELMLNKTEEAERRTIDVVSQTLATSKKREPLHGALEYVSKTCFPCAAVPVSGSI